MLPGTRKRDANARNDRARMIIRERDETSRTRVEGGDLKTGGGEWHGIGRGVEKRDRAGRVRTFSPVLVAILRGESMVVATRCDTSAGPTNG